jgi:hypothetical protein
MLFIWYKMTSDGDAHPLLDYDTETFASMTPEQKNAVIRALVIAANTAKAERDKEKARADALSLERDYAETRAAVMTRERDEMARALDREMERCVNQCVYELVVTERAMLTSRFLKRNAKRSTSGSMAWR